eukprot:5727247-Prymnesium_polylepis.1
MVALAASKLSAPAFTPSVTWEGRKWLRWERLLYSASQSPAVGIAVLAVLLPVSLASLPLLPLVSLALLRAPPTPCGAYDVGVAEIQPTLYLRPRGGPQHQTQEQEIRLRVFYPAARATPPRLRLSSLRSIDSKSGGKRSWLPRGRGNVAQVRHCTHAATRCAPAKHGD